MTNTRSSLSGSHILAGAGVIAVILVTTILLSLQRVSSLKNIQTWNVRSYQLLLDTNHILSGIAKIQTGAGGFLRSGDPSQLNAYRNGRKEYRIYYAKALALSSNDAAQHGRFEKLDQLASAWRLDSIEPIIAMRRATPSLARALALAAPAAHTRGARFGELANLVTEIKNTELQSLKTRTAAENKNQIVGYMALLTLGAFGIVLTCGLALPVAMAAGKLQQENKALDQAVAASERAQRDAQILSEHNEMILLAARDGIAGVNQAGRTTFFNPAAEAMTGYSAADLIGRPQHTLLHSKRADGTLYPVEECPITATIADGTVRYADDEVFWHKDGTPIEVEFTSAPLVMARDDDGEARTEGRQVGAVIIFRDIGQRKAVEAALRQLASVVRHTNDAIIAFDLNGIVTVWNLAATATYGFSETEMVGQSVNKLLPPEEINEMPRLLSTVKAGAAVEHYETTRLHKDGSNICVVLSVSPTRDKSGQVIGASSISREVFRDRQRKSSAAHSIGATN